MTPVFQIENPNKVFDINSEGGVSTRFAIGMVVSVFFLVSLDAVSAQEGFIDGHVQSVKKYSFVVQGAEGSQEFRIDRSTQIIVRLIKPKLDWGKRTAVIRVPASSQDGRLENDVARVFKLPPQLFFRNRFDSDEDRINKTSQDPIQLDRIILSGKSVESSSGNNPLYELRGELLPTAKSSVFQVDFGGVKRRVDLSDRVLRIDGFNVLDLIPGEVVVYVNFRTENSRRIAEHVEFVPVVDYVKQETEKLPRCLVIGDSISIRYLKALKDELQGKMNVHHPASNCRSSREYTRFHRWLGLYKDDSRKWDVIAFNFGHGDASLSQMDYQLNLEKCIKELKKTRAKLIWVHSTPVPFGFNDPKLKDKEFIPANLRNDFEYEETNPVGLVPGRMRLQNQWAEEVMDRHPEIQICDLWGAIKFSSKEVYKDWWFGKDLNFRYPQTKPVAQALANKLGSLLE